MRPLVAALIALAIVLVVDLSSAGTTFNSLSMTVRCRLCDVHPDEEAPRHHIVPEESLLGILSEPKVNLGFVYKTSWEDAYAEFPPDKFNAISLMSNGKPRSRS